MTQPVTKLNSGTSGVWPQTGTASQSNSPPSQGNVEPGLGQVNVGAYDAGMMPGDGDGDQAALQKAVAEYTKDTGRTAGDFFSDLTSELHGVNGLALELAKAAGYK